MNQAISAWSYQRSLQKFRPIRDREHKDKEFLSFFFDQIRPFLELGYGPKTFLGSTDIDKQLLFSDFCSILSPSNMSRWVD